MLKNIVRSCTTFLLLAFLLSNTVSCDFYKKNETETTYYSDITTVEDETSSVSLVQEEAPITDMVPFNGTKIRIACVGDSVTYGSIITDRINMSYPAQLQQMLGDKFEVGNFGKSSAYVLPHESPFNTYEKNAENPALSYKNTAEYSASISFKPDVVIIMLGSNDIRTLTVKSRSKLSRKLY